MVFVRTLNDAGWEILNISSDILMSEKQSQQVEYRYHSRSKGESNKTYFYNEFYFQFVNELKAFLMFLYFWHNEIKLMSDKSRASNFSQGWY